MDSNTLIKTPKEVNAQTLKTTSSLRVTVMPWKPFLRGCATHTQAHHKIYRTLPSVTHLWSKPALFCTTKPREEESFGVFLAFPHCIYSKFSEKSLLRLKSSWAPSACAAVSLCKAAICHVRARHKCTAWFAPSCCLISHVRQSLHWQCHRVIRN